MFLSKSDYMLGLGCQKALWLKKNRKDLMAEVDAQTQARFDNGNFLQELARCYFPEGVMVPGDIFDIVGGAERTWALAQQHDVLFEATALLQNNAFCRIDVLIRNGSGWDMIEIKGATKVKNEFLDDLSYQKYVFDCAGYPIKRCFVMHVNSGYLRNGQLDIQNLFHLTDVTYDVLTRMPAVPAFVAEFLKKMHINTEPDALLKSSCRDCPFFAYCGREVPDYSVFDLLKSKANDLYAQTGILNVADVPADICSTSKQQIDRNAYIANEEYVEPDSIRNWLNSLLYPLYYLDFETLQSPVPLFDNSMPYAQIPFQFSLHIQHEPNGAVQHVGFLHRNRTDPRRAFAEKLVEVCGNSGSVIVYNAAFERTRINEMAHLFADLHNDLMAINNRMIDQLIPFRWRYLYSPKQKSSASIKYVLPAFSDLSYTGMEIANGGQAMSRYLDFMNGKLSPTEEQILFDGLEKYCEQDTYAMVVLMTELYKRSM